ncbi:MAG: ABC transporter permease [Polyangiaceae bacterium]|nr:ABC transporter permease [Polyangiaceae bacterium]
MKTWLRFLLGRMAGAVIVVWIVVSAVFALAYVLPADPARAAVGPHADVATIERVRVQLCLDKPFLTQYGCHVGRLAKLDFGMSFRSGRPVSKILAERIGPTALLAFTALGLMLCIAAPLAMIGTRSRRKHFDRVAMVATWILQGVPPFVLGPLLAILFSYRLGLLPASGAGEFGVDRFEHLILPAFTLALGGIATYARLLQGELSRSLAAPHVRVALAKGASDARALVNHALPLAVGPIIAIAGVDLGVLLGGAAITEYVFGWPGLGHEAVMGVLELDLPVVLGVVLVTAIAVVLANLIADIVHAIIDPRVRPR